MVGNHDSLRVIDIPGEDYRLAKGGLGGHGGEGVDNGLRQWMRSEERIRASAKSEQEQEDAHERRDQRLFLDLTMPVMNGFQVLEAIQHEGLDTFVIVVSADVQSGAVERAKALGAIGFVAKPVSPEAIRPILAEYGLHE